MGGKRKAQEGKKTVFALSVPTTAVFLSGTVGLSLDWLWEVKKEKERKEKKETRFLHVKFNLITYIKRPGLSLRFQIAG